MASPVLTQVKQSGAETLLNAALLLTNELLAQTPPHLAAVLLVENTLFPGSSTWSETENCAHMPRREVTRRLATLPDLLSTLHRSGALDAAAVQRVIGGLDGSRETALAQHLAATIEQQAA